MFNFKIYQNSKFLQILEKVYKIERVKIFKNNRLNRKTTFFKSKVKRGNFFNMPFNFYYSPFIDDVDNYFKTLKNFSLKTKLNVTIKSLIDYKVNNKILYAYNPILLLENNFKNKYSKNLIKNIKRNRNKAKRNNIVFYKTNNVNDIVNFYNNVFSTVYINKHKMVFQPLNLFVQLFDKNLMDVFIAKQDTKIVGGLCCIKDDKIYHYNWGANLNINNIAIGTLLIDYAIDYAYNNGYKIFDFGSTPLSDVNLLNFKLKWGAKKYNVYQYYTLEKPIQIDLNNSYLLLRNIYSKFPKQFLRWLMPRIIPYLVQ